MAIRKTLLQIVQDILSTMDSEAVNSISDTDEATQVASIVEAAFYNLVAAKTIPEHKEILPLTSLGDSTRPTHFTFNAVLEGSSVRPNRIKRIEYNISTGSTQDWRNLYYVEPERFLDRALDSDGSSSVSVTDVRSTVRFLVFNERMPTYWTSFDDEHVVMDGFKSTVESTLQSSKTRMMASVIPSFSLSDSYVPDIDDQFHPLLLGEAKSMALSLFNEGTDPKVEQANRRLKNYLQNDTNRTSMGNRRPNYGRK